MAFVQDCVRDAGTCATKVADAIYSFVTMVKDANGSVLTRNPIRSDLFRSDPIYFYESVDAD